MAEIKVVEGDERPQILSEEELFELYAGEDIARTESLVQLHNLVPKMREFYAKPTIPELLLKKIITMGGDLITPVVQLNKTKKVISRHGGAPQDKKESLKIKFDNNLAAMTETGHSRVIPRGDEITVVGLRVSVKCAAEHPLKSADLLTREYDPCAGIHHTGCFYLAGKKITEPTTFIFESGKMATILDCVFDYVRSEHKSDVAAKFDTLVGAAISAGAGPIWDILRPPRQKAPPIIPEPPHMTAIIEVEKAFPGRLTVVAPEAALSDAMRAGIVRIYDEAMLDGDISALVAENAAANSRKRFINDIRADMENRRAIMGVYLAIIRKKFGDARGDAVAKKLAEKPAASLDVKRLLVEILTPAERKPVELEYKRREKYIENAGKNKCGHVGLYNKLFAERSARDARETLEALKKFFKGGGGAGGAGGAGGTMIECNTCGYDIMCPHLRDLLEAEHAGADQRGIRAVVSKYIDKNGARSQFFCKICGELLSALEDGDDYKGIDDSVGVDEDISNAIWGEIAQLTRFLKFEVLVDTTKLISAARDACYPFIYDIERQLIKSRTSSADELKSKRRLYMTIYGFAYFIHLVGKNVKFRDFDGGGRGGSVTVEAIKHVVRLIMMIRNIAIKNIPGMTADIIKNKVVEAYKSLTAAGNVIVGDISEDILDTLLVDPVYHYIERMHTAASGRPAKNILENVDSVMGMTIQKLEKAADDVFAGVKLPNFSKWNTAAFTELPQFDGKILKGGKLLCDIAAAGYRAAAFGMFLERAQSKIHLAPVFARTDEDLGVVFDQIQQADIDKNTEFIAVETNYAAYVRAAHARGCKTAPVEVNRAWTPANNTKIGRIYDLAGTPHSWAFVVGESVMGARDYAAARMKGEDPGDPTDKKCQHCGVLWSASEELDENQIRAALRDKYTTSNFFKYFETRCPESGVHERNGAGKCTKCGHHVEFLAASGAGAAEYRAKYIAIYEAERGVVASSYAPTVYAPPRDFAEYAAEFDIWTVNFDVVLDLAEKAEANHRVLLALGSVEKQEFTDVTNGTYVPAEVDDRNSTRAGIIDGHIRRLTIEYNRLRYIGNIPKPPQELIDLVDAVGISRVAAAEMGRRLPEILDKYDDKYAYFRLNKRPRDIIGFLLQTWCTMCLKIWNDPAPDTQRLRREFVKRYVASAVRYEELLSKPGQFNWSLLFNDKKERAALDSNVTGEEVEAVAVVADDDDDGGGFDIDIDPDADPEDTDGGIRVGEDYGMD